MTDPKFTKNADLTAANTLRLPSVAAVAAFTPTIDAVRAAVEWSLERSLEVTVIGGGSNVVMHRRIEGCVIVPRLDYVVAHDLGERVCLRVGAGTVWHDLVRYTLGQGLFGLENLALIPGSVGGAPVQNIGAYGVELESVLESVTAVSLSSGDLIEFNKSECEFGYRDSLFRRAPSARHIIVEVALLLSRRAQTVTTYPDVAAELAAMGRSGHRPIDVADAVVRVRRRKLPDPRWVPNAGSFFKNPIVTGSQLDAIRGQIDHVQTYPTATAEHFKVPAARLIDACGFKRRPMARAAVWPRQALVLINRGGADAQDMLGFAASIAEAVDKRFGVPLELEPRIIGGP